MRPTLRAKLFNHWLDRQLGRELGLVKALASELPFGKELLAQNNATDFKAFSTMSFARRLKGESVVREKWKGNLEKQRILIRQEGIQWIINRNLFSK